MFFGSATVGLERSRPGHASSVFTLAGVGVGQIGSVREPSPDLAGRFWGGPPAGPQTDAREVGPALDAAVGYRLAPDPGPVGFVFEIRTNHVIAAHRSVHLLALALGLTIYPR